MHRAVLVCVVLLASVFLFLWSLVQLGKGLRVLVGGIVGVTWQLKGLSCASCILAWISWKLKSLICSTSSIEFCFLTCIWCRNHTWGVVSRFIFAVIGLSVLVRHFFVVVWLQLPPLVVTLQAFWHECGRWLWCGLFLLRLSSLFGLFVWFIVLVIVFFLFIFTILNFLLLLLRSWSRLLLLF